MSESGQVPETQTQPKLAAVPPRKLAPPAISGFSLVLLERGPNDERSGRVLSSLAGRGKSIPRSCPSVIRRGLSLADALLGQFELICADSIAVFIDDEVLLKAQTEYLADVYRRVRRSPEFESVNVRIESLPASDQGVRFLRQFFDDVALAVPSVHVVARKKARAMHDWASKLGASVIVAATGPSAN